MKRTILILLLALALALTGCQPTVPEGSSGAVESSSSFDDTPQEPEESSSSQESPSQSVEAPEEPPSSQEEKLAAQRAAEEAAAQKAKQEEEAARRAAEEAAQRAQEEEAARLAEEEAARQDQLDAFAAYTSGDAFLSKVEKKVIDLTNDERERNGLGRLETDSTLGEAARIRSRELYEHDHFDHTRPNGDSWVTVLTEDLLYPFHHAGENLASVEYNDPNGTYAYDADYWVTTWIESPPHYENMLRDTYTKIGVGIYLAQEGDMTVAYATTIFSD